MSQEKWITVNYGDKNTIPPVGERVLAEFSDGSVVPGYQTQEGAFFWGGTEGRKLIKPVGKLVRWQEAKAA